MTIASSGSTRSCPATMTSATSLAWASRAGSAAAQVSTRVRRSAGAPVNARADQFRSSDRVTTASGGGNSKNAVPAPASVQGGSTPPAGVTVSPSTPGVVSVLFAPAKAIPNVSDVGAKSSEFERLMRDFSINVERNFTLAQTRAALKVSNAVLVEMLKDVLLTPDPSKRKIQKYSRGSWSQDWPAGATMFALLSGQIVHVATTGTELLIAAATRPARSLADERKEAADAAAEEMQAAAEAESAARQARDSPRTMAR